MNRNEKEQVVQQLHDTLAQMQLGVLAGYSGLSVEKLTSLRVSLRKADSEVKVIKNTLMRLAAQGTDFSVLEDSLKGPLALIMTGKDVVEPAKVLVDFAKKNAELEIKGGVLNGKILTKEQINALAALPSREVLLSKLLSVLVGVPTGLVTVLSGVPRNFVQVLDAVRAKKEAGN